MIKFNNQVPSVYPSASRDFQYLSWLIDIVLNSVKHNVDDIYNLPNNKADPRLTELLAMTLGFKVKRNYDQNQLSALVAALPRILKYKGTKTAVDMAGKALISASGAAGSFQSDVVGIGELQVIFPVNLVDISLFTDLLEYILPAGMTCHIIRQNQEIRDTENEFAYEDILYAECIPAADWDSSNKNITGLASLFDIDELASANQEIIFTNYKEVDGQPNTNIPNIGLLDNTIIPTFERPIQVSLGQLITSGTETSTEQSVTENTEDMVDN